MGAGLYCVTHGVTAYAEPYPDPENNHDDDEHALACIDAYWGVRAALITALGRGFSLNGDYDRQRRAMIVATSGLHAALICDDDYGRLHITIAPRTDIDVGLEGLARSAAPPVARRVFDRVHTTWPLRIRSGPWMSTPYTAGELVRAS